MSAKSTSNQARAVNFIQSGTGAVSETVQDVLRRVVWLENYGGGPSASAADNATAFAAAITYLNSVGGGVIMLGRGSYSKSGTTRLKANITIRGQGMLATTVLQTTDVTAFEMNETTDGALVRDVGFEDLIIQKQAETATTGVYGINLVGTTNNVWGARLKNIIVLDFYDGVRIVQPIFTELTNVDSFSNVNDGIVVTGSGTSTEFERTFCRSNGRYGYNITGGVTYLSFVATAADENGSHGYFFGLSSGNFPTAVSFVSAGSESNAGDGFNIQDCENFSGSIRSISNSGDGIQFDGARGMEIWGRISGNSGYGIRSSTSSTPKIPSALVNHATVSGNTAGRISDLTVVSDLFSPDTNTFDYCNEVDARLGFKVDGTTVVDSSRVVQNLGFGSQTYHWYKVSTTYSNFAAASTNGDYALPTQIPDGSVIVDVYVQLTQEFSGGAVASATLEVGDAGSPYNNFIPATNVFTGAGTGYKATNVTDRGSRLYDSANKTPLRTPVMGGARTITARVTTTGANTNALTAGAATIWVGFIKLS